MFPGYAILNLVVSSWLAFVDKPAAPVVVTYPVADLVIPVKPRAEARPQPLITMIRNKVGNGGKVVFQKKTLSLIIAESQQNHAKIQALLKQLRTGLDVQIVLEFRYLSLTKKLLVKAGVSEKVLAAEKFLTTKQMNSLVSLAQKDTRCDVTQVPKVTVFDGQAASLSMSKAGWNLLKKQKNAKSIVFRATASKDRKRVSVLVSANAKTPAEAIGNAIAAVVPSGKYLLVPTSRESKDLPMLSKIPHVARLFKNTGTVEEFLLVRATVLVMEEEEELLIGNGIVGDRPANIRVKSSNDRRGRLGVDVWFQLKN